MPPNVSVLQLIADEQYGHETNNGWNNRPHGRRVLREIRIWWIPKYLVLVNDFSSSYSQSIALGK